MKLFYIFFFLLFFLVLLNEICALCTNYLQELIFMSPLKCLKMNKKVEYKKFCKQTI